MITILKSIWRTLEPSDFCWNDIVRVWRDTEGGWFRYVMLVLAVLCIALPLQLFRCLAVSVCALLLSVWFAYRPVGKAIAHVLMRLQPPETLAGDDHEFQIIWAKPSLFGRRRWCVRQRFAGLYFTYRASSRLEDAMAYAERLRRAELRCSQTSSRYISATNNY